MQQDGKSDGGCAKQETRKQPAHDSSGLACPPREVSPERAERRRIRAESEVIETAAAKHLGDCELVGGERSAIAPGGGDRIELQFVRRFEVDEFARVIEIEILFCGISDVKGENILAFKT